MNLSAQPLEIPAVDIYRIFQLSNPHIYNLIPTEAMGENIYNCMNRMFSYFKAPTAAIIDNDDKITEFMTSISQFQNGSVAMTVAFKHLAENGDIQDWIYFAIAESVDMGEELPDDQRYKIRPVYILSGMVTKDKNFIPYDSLCCPPSDTPSGSAAAPPKLDESNFYSTIKYADAIFLSCLLGEEVDTDKFAGYLDPADAKDAKDYYSRIKRRTAESLSRQLIAGSEALAAPTTGMVFSAPPMPQ